MNEIEHDEKCDALLDINEKEEEAKEMRHRFLRKHGWQYSCKFPGGYWLWCKEINGRLIAVGSTTACSIEVNL